MQAHWLTQRFDDAEAEAELRLDWAERTLRQVRWALGLGLLMIVAFGLLDLALIPEVVRQTWLIRYAVLTPIGLAVFAWSFTPGFLRRMQLAGALAGAVGGFGTVALVAIAPAPGRDLYYAGLLQAMLFTYTFFRLRLVVAAPVCLSYTAAYLALLALAEGPPGPVTISNAVVVVTFNLLGGAVCYFLEQAMRRDFLQRRLIAQQAERLAESLGKVKVLTGLLPICAWCHDVHADDGSWQRIELYLERRSEASFTHGICPSCQAKVAAGRS